MPFPKKAELSEVELVSGPFGGERVTLPDTATGIWKVDLEGTFWMYERDVADRLVMRCKGPADGLSG